jgi:transposase-like protein
MSEKHLTAKVNQLKLDLQEKRKENRDLRRQFKASSENRDMWKAKCLLAQSKLAKFERTSRVVNSEQLDLSGIKGHKFNLKVVTFCVMLYVFAGCSFRSVHKVLGCFQSEYGLLLGDLPSKTSIENWVQKLGYSEYTDSGTYLYEGDYGIIIDESMVVGQQRMMLVLGVDAVKSSEKALCFGTVRLLYIAVRPSWNWEDVVKLLDKVAEKMGKKPVYVISDGGNNLTKGIKKAELKRIPDVGHQIAKYVEQTYAHQEQFKAFTTAVAGVKFREIMKGTAYLLPPKQRTIARFMNLSGIVDWAANILRVFGTLSLVEQETFSFLKDFRQLIKELKTVFEMTHKMLEIIKNKGISYENIAQCTILGKQYGAPIPTILTDKITAYLKEIKDKLPDATTTWHASSDVLESLFGKYKQIASPNKLNGITPFVLSLCVYTNFDAHSTEMANQIKFALENVSMSDLKVWKHENLIDNQVVRRIKTLKK